MAIYCIGDLHGRFDLFQMLLNKIGFNHNNDKLYVLGDVIDHSYGAIKIIDYLMEHQSSCFLVEGNHEAQFAYMRDAYDLIMLHPDIKDVMTMLTPLYSENLFAPISKVFTEVFSKAKRNYFYSHPAIKEWLKSGDARVRQRLLDAMVALADCINYDDKVFQKITWILSNFRGQYKMKPFVQELLEQPTEKYLRIKEYLSHLTNHYEFTYNDTHFYLCHWKGNVNRKVSYKSFSPHALTKNVTYIFGHDPVPALHLEMQNSANSFDFDYRRIFSWVDTNKNRYYWMDLASNPIAALRLDDMTEYYVGIPSTRKNASVWTVPTDTTPILGKTYQHVKRATLGCRTFTNSAIVTSDNGCFEFLIGINKDKRIYYTHLGWWEYRHAFTIDNWLNGHSVDEIIDKVRVDFEEKQKLEEHRFAYNYLHGIK